MFIYNLKNRYIPKRFESWDQKKYRLQEQMSGLKQFSAFTGKKCVESTVCDDGDEYQIDPTKECKLNIEHFTEMIVFIWIDVYL